MMNRAPAQLLQTFCQQRIILGTLKHQFRDGPAPEMQ